MKKWTKGAFLLMLFFCLQGCVKDLQEIDNIEVSNWQPEVAVALVNTSVSIQDLLDDFDSGGHLEVDNDQFMTLVYESNVFSVSGDKVIEMPDFTIPVVDTNVVVPYAMINTPFDIDFFSIKSGQLDYAFQSPYPEDMDVIIEVKNITQNGSILQFTEKADYTSSSPVNVNGSINLAGYNMDFANDEIKIRYIATDNQGNRKHLDNMSMSFNSFEYDLAQGYFDQHEFILPTDTILIDLFENSIAGNIQIENPIIRLIIKNSFGVPIQMSAQNLEAETVADGTMSINTVLDNGVSFNYPSIMEVGQFKTTTIEINSDNSNLADVISNSPKQLNYEWNAMSNPEANTSLKGFVKDDSRFDVGVEVEMPVWFSAQNFEIEEVSEFDASFLDDVVTAEFKLITENGLPVEAGVQVYFLDDNGMVLDSLLNGMNNTLIPSASVDNNGKVTTPSVAEEVVELSESRLDNIRNATQIGINGTVSTAEMGTVAVRFYADYGINFKLGVKAKLKE